LTDSFATRAQGGSGGFGCLALVDSMLSSYIHPDTL
jgi:hypothetical protein